MGFILKKMGKVFLAKRWRRFEKFQENPEQAQAELWAKIRAGLLGTQIANKLQLDKIQTYQEYLTQIPVHDYEFYRPLIEAVALGEQSVLYHGPTRYFGLTSGTSGQHKKIPYNDAMLELFRNFRNNVGALINHKVPNANVLRDIQFKYASSPVTYLENNIVHGYASGIMAVQPVRFYNAKMLPSERVFHLQDWSSQLDAITGEVKNQDIKIINGIPTYMLHLFEGILERTGKKNLSELWPNLEAFVYMATPIEPYRQDLQALIGKKIPFLGAYVATESAMGLEVAPGQYALDFQSTLFTFSPPQNPQKVLSPKELQLGEDYLLNIGTPNGMLQYALKDKVRVVQLSPLRFEFRERAGHEINAAGEKMSEKNLTTSLIRVREKLNHPIEHFFVYPKKGGDGRFHYQWLLCGRSGESHLAQDFARNLEEELLKLNTDYQEIRLKDQVLGASHVTFISPQLARSYFTRFKHLGQLKMKSAFQSEEDFGQFWAKTFPQEERPRFLS